MMSQRVQVPTVELAKGGPRFSRLAYGAWRFTDAPGGATAAAVADKIKHCLDVGITTIDHADIYGDYACEELFGAALATLGGRVRDSLQLVTKCGIKLLSAKRPTHRVKSYDTGRSHIIASVEASLQLLRTDYVDLLLIHRPDPLMEADEVAEAFATLKKQGKVHHFGVSNFRPHQLSLLQSRLDEPLVTNQIEFSPLCLEPLTDGVLDQCQQLRIKPMIWSPLAGGRLATGSGVAERRLRDAFTTVGRELGEASAEQVALAWVLRHPSQPVPVIGTGSLERIAALAQATRLELTRDQWHLIWTAAMGHEVA